MGNKSEDIILICFDPNNELEDLKIQLFQINGNVVFHTKLEPCISFIQSIEKDKIFLIIPDSYASQILPHTTQIDCIFIFCLNNDSYKNFSLGDSKIIGIYDKLNLLCSTIKEQIDFAEKQICTWCFFDQDQYENKDLSKQPSDFLWLHLFHDVLLHLSRDEQARKQMINSCRLYYRENSKELQLIDEFDREYQHNDAIYWYLKYSFLNKMINKALQTNDTNQLYMLRYFLSDLIQNISLERQQVVQSDRKNLIVYREMKLSNYEFNQMQKHKGKLISMKGFLTASTEQSSSRGLRFLRLMRCFGSSKTDFRRLRRKNPNKTQKRPDFISVVFEIECNIKALGDSIIFADTTKFNDLPNQKTILFDLNTTFLLENIEKNGQLWSIKLNVVNDGRTIKQKYIDDTHRQIEDLSIPIIFGKVISDMCQWNQSQTYFEHLLNDQHDEDLAWIEYSIGQCHRWKGEWNEARTYFDRSYNRMMTTAPIRVKDSAVILSGIGEILHIEGHDEEAYEFHQRALTIHKKYYSSDHSHIATSLKNIGLVRKQQQKYAEALFLLQEALSIQEKYYNYFHVDTAVSLTEIGGLLTSQGKNAEALDYCQRAMSVYEKCYLSDYFHIAITLNCIGYIFYQQEKYEEGLEMIQRALMIQKKYHPFGHIDIAISLSNLGNIRFGQGKYDESLHLHQEVLAIQMKYYLSDNTETISTLNNIGYIQLYGKGNYDKAFEYHQRALTILETSYPSYYAHIGFTLVQIGNILIEQGKTDEALNFYLRARKFQEDYYSSDHVEMVSVLTYIGHALCNHEKFDEALVFYQKSLTIQQKNYPLDYIDISYTLNNIALVIQKKYYPSGISYIADTLAFIGNVFYGENKSDQALEYYQQALELMTKLFPSGHVKIADFLSHIGKVLYNQDNFDEALEFYRQELLTKEKFYSSSHTCIINSLTKIGRVKFDQREFDESLGYYQRALAMLKEFQPINYSEIVFNLEWIVAISNQKQSYNQSVEYLEKCLRIREASLSPRHPSIALTLDWFGEIQRVRDQYELSLAYELQCLMIREKSLPPDHEDIGKSLSNIGECYNHLHQFKPAYDYYKRALVVYEQCLPQGHQDRWNLETKIEELSKKIEKNNA